MKLLLDTHIWLWVSLEPDRLAPRVESALRNEQNELWLSPVSLWETMMLAERGRIELDDEPSRWIGNALRETPARDAPLTREVAVWSRQVDLPHQDPADRFIAATAIVHDLTLATADERLLACAEVATLAN